MIRLLLACALFLSVPASAGVSVQEYPIPEDLYAHDVWADPAPDGPVYFSAQSGGKLGILDPKSGKVDTVDLGRGAAPHGVIQGADGAVWLTDGGRYAIVRVDPKTKELKRFALPEDGGHANLNTAAFDGQGALWFTGQAGVYGRLDPKSGAMKIFQAPRGPGPYGIQSTPGGAPYFASLAGSYVARIDVASGAARLVGPPTPRQGARRVWADAGGRLWVSEWNTGNLSRYDRHVEILEGAGARAAPLRGLRRRERQGVGVGLDHADHAALRPGEREVRDLQVLERPRQRAPDPRPAGRGVDAGVGGRQAGGVSLPLSGRKQKSAPRRAFKAP